MRISDWSSDVCSSDLHGAADLILYPEMQLIGYPPEDLVLKPALAERAAGLLGELAAETGDGGPAMLVGSVERDAEGKLYNMVALLDGGRIVATRRKHELPNYGTFDEKRVFAAGTLPEPVEIGRASGRARVVQYG